MRPNLDHIETLVRRSDLSPSDQDLMIAYLSNASEAELQPIMELFMSHPKWIRKVSDNYHAKRFAVLTGNYDLWKRILDDEEAELKNAGL